MKETMIKVIWPYYGFINIKEILYKTKRLGFPSVIDNGYNVLQIELADYEKLNKEEKL